MIVLSHEIGHFVGSKLRMRERRYEVLKESLIRLVGLHTYLDYGMSKFFTIDGLVFHPDRNRSRERSVTHHCVVKISSRWPTSPSKFCLALARTRPLTTPFSVRMNTSTTANFLKAWSFYGPDRHNGSCVCSNIQSLSYS